MKRPVAMMVMVAMGLGLSCCGAPSKGPEPLSSTTQELAIATLQEQAHSGRPEARANCMEALQYTHDPRALEVIEQGLHDSEWVVRFAAAMAAGEQRAAAVRPVLNTMVANDPNLSVRAGCVFALARLGDDSHVTELGRIIASDDPGVRANTALVLSKLGPMAIPLLERYRNDVDVRVRFAITAALARLGDESAQRIIVSECVNKFAEDQLNAMEVCADLPAYVGSSPLLLGLTDAPPKLPAGVDEGQVRFLTTYRQLAAARSLAKMKYNNEQAAELAITNRANADPRLRAMAVIALGDMLTGWDAPQLEKMLHDEDEGVRRAAAAAVVNVYARAARRGEK
jgi:HEAT repeat protein